MHTLVKNLFEAIIAGEKSSSSFLNDIEYNIKKINNEIFLLLTVCDNTLLTFVIQGRGSTFQEAVDSALHIYYRKTKRLRFRPRSLKLDIVVEVQTLNNPGTGKDINQMSIGLLKGKEGFAWGNALEVIFLPEEVAVKPLIDKQILNVKRIVKALDNHWISKRDERILDYIELPISFQIHKIKTVSYFVDEMGPLSLYNGHRLFSKISLQDILDAITLTKDHYFKNILSQKGKYIYSYLPQSDSKENRYNILRHAGTTYALLETYEFITDNDILPMAESAIEYLIEEITDYEINGNTVSVVIEKDVVKLGGNALAIIALAKYTQVTGNQKYLTTMQQLATWIQEVQNEAGQFTVNMQQFSTGEIDPFTSQYYPGEAMLGLIRLFQIDGNQKWLDIAEKAAYYLIEVRDKHANVDTITHDHWLLYALNELYRERPKDRYLQHVLLISQAILKSQIIDDCEDVDWRGAYRLPQPRLESTPTACRSEGLCAAYRLMLHVGKDEEAAQLRAAIEEGVRFQLQNQLRPESVLFYKNKNLCLGAFQRGFAQYELRIDYTQHNISSLIAYYKILSE